MGKSRLGRELLARHPEVTGLAAQAYPLAASAAFGLWTEALDPFLQSLPASEVVELCGGLLDDLASVFHSVALVRGSVPERDPPLPRLLQGLAGLLGSLSRRSPLVVLLDDVHFADASSWEALRYLARHLDDAPLLVLATSRPAELADHDVAAPVLFELDQDALLSRLEVATLARAGIAELTEAVIDRPAPRALVDWVCERSQGNPLFAIGLLRALIDERGNLFAPHLERLPEGLTERVTSELRRLDPGPQEMLELLAVVERPVTLSDLTVLTASPLEEIGPILAELVRARIVVEDERGGELSYELQHPLVRDVIYQATVGARRRVLHRQAARSLLRTGHLAEAALHFARSAESGDSEAVEVLLDAMRQAERREAYREALELQAELVDLLPADDQRWLEVLEAMYARAEWLIDHRAESDAPVAVRALRAIDGLLEGSTDHRRRAIVKFRLANFLAWGTGDLEPAYDACEQARELFTRAGDQRQALLASRELGWIKGLRGDLVAMAADASAVVQAADAIDDRFVAMQGLAAVSFSATFRGAFAEGEAALRRAETIAREDDKAYRLTVVLGGLAINLALQGRTGETAALFEEAKAANRAYRDTILIELETLDRLLAGDYAAARAMAREAVAWLPGVTARRRAPGPGFGALAAIEGGDAARGRASAGTRPRGARRPRLGFLSAGRALGAGPRLPGMRARRAEGVAVLRSAVARLLEMEARPRAATALFDLAEAAADAGDVAAATAAADDLRAVAEVIGLPLYRGLAAAGMAWARLARGESRASGGRLRGRRSISCRPRAVPLTPRGPTTCSADRWRRTLGAEAVAAFERSAAMLEQCGASWRRDRALEALRRLGHAGRRAAAAALGPDALTRREHEVARLAATGMSAREIARVAVCRQTDRREPPRERVREARRGFQAPARPPGRGVGPLVSRIRNGIRTSTEDEREPLAYARRLNALPGAAT